MLNSAIRLWNTATGTHLVKFKDSTDVLDYITYIPFHLTDRV